MTARLQRTIAEAEKLPPAVQDSVATKWLADFGVTPRLEEAVPREMAELLDRITPETLHEEVDCGPARGNEAW